MTSPEDTVRMEEKPVQGNPPGTMSVDDVLLLAKFYSRLAETRSKKRDAEIRHKVWRMKFTLMNAASGVMIAATLMILIAMSGATPLAKVLLSVAVTCVPFLMVYALMPSDRIFRNYLHLLDDEIELTRAQISILVSKYGDDARWWNP